MEKRLKDRFGKKFDEIMRTEVADCLQIMGDYPEHTDIDDYRQAIHSMNYWVGVTEGLCIGVRLIKTDEYESIDKRIKEMGKHIKEMKEQRKEEEKINPCSKKMFFLTHHIDGAEEMLKQLKKYRKVLKEDLISGDF